MASAAERPNAAAVVVAAGRGERFGAPDKVLVPLLGRPMLAHVLDAVERAERVRSCVLVVGEHTRAAVEALVAAGGWRAVRAVVSGGERRQDSVAAGVAAVPAGTEVVVVHDAARPLAPPDLFDRCVAAAASAGAAIAAVPVVDTLKRVEGARIAETVDRAGLWAAQTPQAFQRELLVGAIARSADLPDLTDEAGLCEALGIPVEIVLGSPANLKITRPDDLPVAEALLRAAPARPQSSVLGPQSFVRTGIGYDVHRLAPDRRLVLGGVEIPHPVGLEGHSDADVLLHAVADALLGAAALGDIGQHFPPSDPRFAGADSRDLLREVARLLAAAGFAPVNVDATLVAEAPRVGPHAPAMRTAIAACLGLPEAAVSIKATTNEGMGFLGRQEGIAALATATVAPLPGGGTGPGAPA